MAFKAAICPSCGGQLQVPDDRDSVKCMYCGTEIVVREAIQAGSGVNIHNYLDLAATADKTGNYKEAYDYYSKVLEIEIKNVEAWFGKAKAAGWLSTVGDSRFPEMISGFQNAINYSSEKDKKALQIQCAVTISRLSAAYFDLIYKYVFENASVEGVWETYLSQSEKLISLLEFGHSLDPNNQNIMAGIVNICTTTIEGVKYQYYDRYINAYGATTDVPNDGVRRVSQSYEQSLKNKINLYSNKLMVLDQNYKPPEIKKKSSCCFVITATMENRNHPYVLCLQEFRESWLLKRGYGRQFNRYYMILGPSLANIIRNRRILRALSLYFIVRPGVWIASKCLNKQKIEN